MYINYKLEQKQKKSCYLHIVRYQSNKTILYNFPTNKSIKNNKINVNWSTHKKYCRKLIWQKKNMLKEYLLTYHTKKKFESLPQPPKYWALFFHCWRKTAFMCFFYVLFFLLITHTNAHLRTHFHERKTQGKLFYGFRLSSWKWIFYWFEAVTGEILKGVRKKKPDIAQTEDKKNENENKKPNFLCFILW